MENFLEEEGVEEDKKSIILKIIKGMGMFGIGAYGLF